VPTLNLFSPSNFDILNTVIINLTNMLKFEVIAVIIFVLFAIWYVLTKVAPVTLK
jgi:hypothetical protein